MNDETSSAKALPFWMAGETAVRLADAAANWFDLLRGWAQWPARQMDPESCAESVLSLLAWQRDIDRFDGEPLALFRKRVAYAYANARDAGSAIGFKRIFERLGVGYVELDERMDGRDWDIVAVRLTDSQLAGNQALLSEIIQHYGRTCRRYEWTVITPAPCGVRAVEFGAGYTLERARVPACAVGARAADFGADFATL
ncbi:MAG: hypothetical protein PWQ57_2030 [Desulfovibrionales bacterium]|nr:hypothetical protein [Desulfovibrionales bacterium]